MADIQHFSSCTKFEIEIEKGVASVMMSYRIMTSLAHQVSELPYLHCVLRFVCSLCKHYDHFLDNYLVVNINSQEHCKQMVQTL